MPLDLIDRPGATDNSIGLVTCPNCQVTMRLLGMKPVKGEYDYRCPQCDAETTRWVRP
jgi:hypothetical protein